MLFVCHDLTELSTIPSIQIVSQEVNAVPWPERLQGSDKGTQAKEAVSAMEEYCAPPTGAASGPPPLNAARLTAIAPDACRLD